MIPVGQIMKKWSCKTFGFQNAFALKNLNMVSLAYKSTPFLKRANFCAETPSGTFRPTVEQVQQAKQIKAKDPLDDIAVPFKISGKFAAQSERLYRIGVLTESLDDIEKDVVLIKELAKKELFKSFLFSHKYDDDTKADVILLSLNNACEATELFIDDLVGKKSFHELNAILTGFERLMRAHRHETQVSVASAKALNSDEIFEVCCIARELVGPKGKIILQARVDPKLVDGFVVRAAGKTHDETYLSRQEFLSKRFQADFMADSNRFPTRSTYLS